LNKPENDLLAEIDETLDFANMPGFTVTAAYPTAWGQGSISPHSGHYGSGYKHGYPFTANFTSSGQYTFKEWRAYSATELSGIDWNTPTSVAAALDLITPLADAVIIGGAEASITINSGRSVTLVPYCEDEPRVVITSPRNGELQRTLGNVTITFASGIMQTTAVSPDNFTVKQRDVDASGNPTGDGSWTTVTYDDWFDTPTYDSDLARVTLPAKASPVGGSPINCEVQITVGTGIKSSTGTNKNLPLAHSFSWVIIPNASVSIDTWHAEYNEAANSITIEITSTTPVNVPGKAFYTLNGARFEASKTNPADTAGRHWTISGVHSLDASGVPSGQNVTNINRYDISLELYSGESAEADTRVTFSLWNIPGMAAENGNLPVEITSGNDLATKVNVNDTKIYVLTNDITLAGTHTPIGTGAGANAFQGKFYGAGHSITVGASFSGATYTGIFGYTDNNAEIRDLTVHYSANASGAANVGGIVGYAAGNTVIRNCAVTGGSGVTLSASGDYLGGIAGRMAATAAIVNTRASLAVSGTGYVGGVVGYIGDGGANHTVLDGVTAFANVTATGTYVGGIVGQYTSSSPTNQPEIRGARALGTITTTGVADVSTGWFRAGGIVGTIYGNDIDKRAVMQDCVFSGKIGESTGSPMKATGSRFLVGGVIGLNGSNGASQCGPDIANCHARSSAFFVDYGGTSTLNVGGFAGSTYSAAVKECSAEGPITIVSASNASSIYFGGFIGFVENIGTKTSEFVRSYATANLTSTSTAAQYVGGFLGYVTGTTTTIANCYATGDISVTGNTCSVGGLVGISYGTTILNMVNCYATGNVKVNAAGTYSSYAGGLIGNINTNVTADHCFTGGTVSIDSSSSSANGAYSGGITGNHLGTITNCAAYGGSVSVSVNTTPHVYRIWGAHGSTSGTGSNNYAFKTMRTGIATSSGGPITWTVPGDSLGTPPDGHDTDNGANAVGDDFRSTWFWQNTLGFKSSETITGTVNDVANQTIASGPAWGFSTVFGKGHPVLLNADGSVMGGQMAAP
jgi:hypothetical protein